MAALWHNVFLYTLRRCVMRRLPLYLLALIVIATMYGCDSEDREAARKKAEQAKVTATQTAEDLKKALGPAIELGKARAREALQTGKEKAGELIEEGRAK